MNGEDLFDYLSEPQLLRAVHSNLRKGTITSAIASYLYYPLQSQSPSHKQVSVQLYGEAPFHPAPPLCSCKSMCQFSTRTVGIVEHDGSNLRMLESVG